jgi:tRNA threonylcarbamoyladenosine biosynthesis protein TsaE
LFVIPDLDPGSMFCLLDSGVRRNDVTSLNNMQKVTESFEETQAFAEEFAKSLHGGEVLCLYGDLGYGKTTFVQGLGKGLGVARHVNSPTFLIMRSYRITGNSQQLTSNDSHEKMLYHVDLYRLEHEQEIRDIGLLDLMHDPDTIVVIEWPEKLGKLLPEKRTNITFEYINEDKRKITIESL